MLLACDGIWDVMTNEEAVEFVHEQLKVHMRIECILMYTYMFMYKCMYMYKYYILYVHYYIHNINTTPLSSLFPQSFY